ncbi:MAG: alpha/beta hydrolase [Rhodocyclaceae bacterium]|nr:alpha/beta hydrolase [Rhodocyclaceae bacterium]MBX3668126.1 alpha/beta hydrolase [Rhodocyclaceae bacterium]
MENSHIAAAPASATSARRPLTWWLRLARAALLIYVCVLAWLYFRQEYLLFPGKPLPPDYRFDVPADVQEVRLPVAGATLSALHLRLPQPAGVVFFLHGNDENLATWFVNTDYYRKLNYDLFMIDYRGYGKSTGRIASQAQLLADVRAAWDYAAPLYAGKRRVIYGRSLGTGPAAILAAAVHPDLTVLVSPYCSVTQVARSEYPFVPGFLVRYPLSTCDAAGQMSTPLLLIHGERDTLIPPVHSEQIRARDPAADLQMIAGAGHEDIHDFPAYLDLLAARLRGLGMTPAGH